MKKLLLVLLVLFLIVGCGKNDDSQEGDDQEETREPIGYKGPFNLRAAKEYSLEELKDQKIGICEYYDQDAGEFVLKELAEYGVSEENVVKFGSYIDIVDCLNDKKFDCFLVDSRLEGVIGDYRNDFNLDNYKLIKSFDVPYYEENEEIKAVKEAYMYSHPFMFMITGTDEAVPADTQGGVRTDVNIVMVVNPEKRHILTVSFPRDSYMRSAKGGYFDKMNAFVGSGIDNTVASVGETLGIPLNNYVQFSFSTFVDVINAIGGLWVHVPYNVYIDQNSKRDVTQPYSVDKGYTKLYGEWALALARNRKYAGLYGGDYGRIRNQALIVNEMIAKITAYPTLLDFLGMVWNYQNFVYTNYLSFDIQTFMELGKVFAEEGYTIDNYFIHNDEGNVNGAFVGYMPQWTLDIAKGKIDLVMTGIVDENRPYAEEILTGYHSGGAGTSADGGYIGTEYDLREVFK